MAGDRLAGTICWQRLHPIIIRGIPMPTGVPRVGVNRRLGCPVNGIQELGVRNGIVDVPIVLRVCQSVWRNPRLASDSRVANELSGLRFDQRLSALEDFRSLTVSKNLNPPAAAAISFEGVIGLVYLAGQVERCRLDCAELIPNNLQDVAAVGGSVASSNGICSFVSR